MTLLAEITDLSACAAWCPIKEYGDLIATGTKDAKNAGFEDVGGALQVYTWQRAAQTLDCIATVQTAARFSTLVWTPYTATTSSSTSSSSTTTTTAGTIVGGMLDGTLVLWDAATFLANHGNDDDNDDKNEAAFLATLPTPQAANDGPITCLAYNPLEPWLLCVGTAHGQTYIVDLQQQQQLDNDNNNNNTAPGLLMTAASRHATQVTAVAWNSQVPHICATAADTSVIVWDCKAQKPWCELTAQSSSSHHHQQAGAAVGHLQWNPQQGLHLITAHGATVHVWDLAASTTLPVAQLAPNYHVQGILQMDWCPHDETLLVTTAKDGKAFVWDLTTLQPIAELPNDASTTAPAGANTATTTATTTTTQSNPASLFAGSSTPSHVRYEIHWSPHTRGVLLTCRLDKHVQILALPALPRPPAWLRPPGSCVVTQGFGAVVATVSSSSSSSSSLVTIRVVPQNQAMVNVVVVEAESDSDSSSTTAGTSNNNNPRDVCLLRQAAAAADPHRSAMWGFLSVLFEANARQALLEYLGYQKEEIQQQVADLSNGNDNDDNPSTSYLPRPSTTTTANALVQKALVVGDFAAAVEACIKVENYADALLLASCGGAELWTATQQQYLEMMRQQRPYSTTVQAILQADLGALVESSDLVDWQQTLAILSTYGTSQEFPALCQALGMRLREAGDAATASLCFICAMDFETVVTYWQDELGNDDSDDWKALHDFCTKVSMFHQACPHAALPPPVATLFTKYAQLLADQGLLVRAAQYAKDGILPDRLYRSRSSPACLLAMQNQPPAYPYTVQAVDACRGVVSLPEQREAARQAKIAAEQRAAQQKQHEEYQAQQRAAQQAAAAAQREQQAAAAAAAAAAKQQQQQQQHAATYQQQANGYGQGAAAPTPASNELPPGWMALQDPSSGMTYYANQTTGETTWERPAPSQAAPAPAPQPAQQQQQQHLPEATPTKAKKTLASKYGDGFVSSASDPKLAFQYGNVGTSNPYHGADRPGPAAAAVGGTQQAPISETFNVDRLELSADLVPLRDSLVQLVESLKTLHLGAADRRQLADGEKAVAVFCKKLARQAIHDESLENAKTMVSSLVSSDFRTATAMQTALVNSDWREHKDWLKGFKSLIQLASRKLAHPHPIQY